MSLSVVISTKNIDPKFKEHVEKTSGIKVKGTSDIYTRLSRNVEDKIGSFSKINLRKTDWLTTSVFRNSLQWIISSLGEIIRYEARLG